MLFLSFPAVLPWQPSVPCLLIICIQYVLLELMVTKLEKDLFSREYLDFLKWRVLFINYDMKIFFCI